MGCRTVLFEFLIFEYGVLKSSAENADKISTPSKIGGLYLMLAIRLHIASDSSILYSQGGDELWQELPMYSRV